LQTNIFLEFKNTFIHTNIILYFKRHGKNIVYLLWTQTHCIVDHTVDIKCLYYEPRCSVMRVLFLLFFCQKVLLGALYFVFSVPKASRSDLAARPNAIESDSQPDPHMFSFFFLFRFFSFLLGNFFSYDKEEIN
jgi:hypothetical protein